MPNTDPFVTLSQQKILLEKIKEYVNNAKSMVYAYPNNQPFLSRQWLSTTKNDTGTNMISPQEDTIYIVQDNGRRYPVLYDDTIKLYRFLDANIANDFVQRTLSDVSYTTIPDLYINKTTYWTTWFTHFTKTYNKGDTIRIYFDFDLYGWTIKNWLNYAQITVSIDGKSWNYQMVNGNQGSYPRTFDQTVELSQDSTLTIQYYKKLSDGPIYIRNGKITEYTSHYNDYETDEYVAPTTSSAGQSGKLPGPVAGTEISVFLSDGRWVTLSELKQMLSELDSNT